MSDTIEIAYIINNIISKNLKGDNLPKPPKKNIIISLIDNSGSTSFMFDTNKTVLAKELELYKKDILDGIDDHYMYSFESSFLNHGKILSMPAEGIVEIPVLRPSGGTFTAKPLLDIASKINIVKPNIIRIYTDGQTSSGSEEIIKPVDQIIKAGTKIEIIAITDSIINMESITKNEESRIPGMDLVNMLNNKISVLKIYNRCHVDKPYIGATNSNIDKKCIKFMGIEIGIPVIIFIKELSEELNKNENINWGENYSIFKTVLVEIGKLWSLLMIEFSNTHPFIINITNELYNAIKDVTFTTERIINIIKYGFDCVKQNKPIIMTNFEDRVKEGAVKREEFKDAIDALNIYGTALNAQKLISMPNTNGMCVIGRNANILTKKTQGTNLTVDKFNNVYIGIDSSEQAIRIGLRNYAQILNYPNARGSSSVIFMTLNEMALLFIKGIDLNCDYMKELRKIAIAQTSMEGMISKGKYDGVGFYKNWQSGNLPSMHFSSPKTHTSLFTDKMINPLNLPETIWWALMMAMLGIYNEQSSNYEYAIAALGIENTCENFLNYIKNTYKDKLTGNAAIENICDLQKSIYTLDDFEETDIVYSLKEHTNHTGLKCNANTWYSEEEIRLFVNKEGCIWCRYKPKNTDFERVNIENPNVRLTDMSKICKPIKLQHVDKEVVDTSSAIGKLNINDVGINENKIRINLIGITGSGKSTCAEKFKNEITKNGGMVCIVNADKWSKQGYKGKDLANKIKQEIMTFDKLNFNGKKVIIMDLCNENGVSKAAFQFNFNEYKDLSYYPNLNKNMFKEYEAWCLNNVISRKAHTRDCNYWLNPVSAGLDICIKVHNDKANKLKQLIHTVSDNNFNLTDNDQTIHQKIDNNVKKYNEYLATINIDDDINKFLADNALI
jgi:hypothetical protein